MPRQHTATATHCCRVRSFCQRETNRMKTTRTLPWAVYVLALLAGGDAFDTSRFLQDHDGHAHDDLVGTFRWGGIFDLTPGSTYQLTVKMPDLSDPHAGKKVALASAERSLSLVLFPAHSLLLLCLYCRTQPSSTTNR